LPDIHNDKRHSLFTQLAAHYLATFVPTAHVPTMPPRTSRELWDAKTHADVEGLPDAAVMISAAISARPAEALDRAREVAKATNKTVPLVVLARPSQSVADSYVVTDLRTLAGLLRDRQHWINSKKGAKS
jgi:hypothetical protein